MGIGSSPFSRRAPTSLLSRVQDALILNTSKQYYKIEGNPLEKEVASSS